MADVINRQGLGMDDMAAGRENVLSCNAINKRYGDDLILRDVHLTLKRGEIVSVLGQSGSGKTTLFNILAGLESDFSGEVSRPLRVGYMLQKDLLLPWKRVIDNIALPLLLKGTGRKEARSQAGAYLETFGLTGLAHRYPATISGGQRQRAALLRTYLYSRDLMLLDEPFSGLDAITREQLYQWLLSHQETLGMSILLITHDIEEAIALSDRVYVMTQGPAATLWPSVGVPHDARMRPRNEIADAYLSEEQLAQVGRIRVEIRRRLFSSEPDNPA
ncbi:MAG TPA: ATP-binding cassette domain-containing protein [Bacillota bacterium]|nr:ATP-binding cassette domain-containing protein [Bacillota bacterium]